MIQKKLDAKNKGHSEQHADHDLFNKVAQRAYDLAVEESVIQCLHRLTAAEELRDFPKMGEEGFLSTQSDFRIISQVSDSSLLDISTKTHKAIWNEPPASYDRARPSYHFNGSPHYHLI